MGVRLSVFFGAIVMGVAWVAILTLLIPPTLGSGGAAANSFAGDLLLDRNTQSLPYPFTIQNLMWVVFFIGIGELLVRYLQGKHEVAQIGKHLLPEDEKEMLLKKDLGSIYRRVRDTDPVSKFWLQRLLSRSILAFQSTGSINHVSTVYNSALELLQHELDLRYNLLRYLVWLIPTLGFIGTVVGIALALKGAGDIFANASVGAGLSHQGPDLMKSLTKNLGVAFYTTLLALLQSVMLMFALHLIQGHEEGVLNRVGQYCLDNLINRLYEKK